MNLPGGASADETARLEGRSDRASGPSADKCTDTFNCLWIGETIGAVERACLQSFIRHGHDLRLWCYYRPIGVPDGVEVRDASEIFSADQIVRYSTGSVSLFSNRFRYELQRLGLGVWVDADLYLLRPIPRLPKHVFAWESRDLLGTAILRFPQDSPLIPSLLEIFSETTVPRWLLLRDRVRATIRLWRTGRTGLAKLPWGTAGPLAVTYYCRKFGVDKHALDRELFYPVHWSRAEWIVDPTVALGDVITDQTIGIHLWNELIKPFKNEPAPAGSFLAQLQSEVPCN